MVSAFRLRNSPRWRLDKTCPRFCAGGWKNSPAASRLTKIISPARRLAAVTLPLTVAAVIVIKPFLSLWVGANFAEIAAPVGEILLVGVWINNLAWVPAVMLQGQGRPAIVAKLHALELVPYAAILWIGMAWAGLQGAAWAWVRTRSLADTQPFTPLLARDGWPKWPGWPEAPDWLEIEDGCPPRSGLRRPRRQP